MTPNKEDYLKCIYEISVHTAKITNKEIAARMQVSPPAVTEMVKRMIEEGLIIKDSKAGYLMTNLGLRLVSDLYRKHRLIEVFLLDKLGYTTDQIHDEAEVLEHTISDLFVERLNQFLDYPTMCPHGGTIPEKGSILVEQYAQTLDAARQIGTYQLTRVHDEFELLRYLEKQDLKLGDTILLTQYDPFTELYSIQTGEKELQISSNIAKQLYVEKID
ncbi:metal-dependent transcriptional regulator [Streptococcus himalayensis]|uniref:Manganese transport regulator n=1 Tax=Streptococcus himalayensis TaxID=1888195 RepID=A0A917A8E4_9STRE|nr:metal-dependent transcriptional regulator [Streptococcus himalayensis]GGE34683.1 MarR family transcriptional regulator [Streptococcus himalayensis]